MSDVIKIAIPCLLAFGSVGAGIVGFFYDEIKQFCFPFKLKKEEEQILFNFLEKKFEIIRKDLNELLSNLIKGNDFLNKLKNKIKILTSKEKNIQELLSSPKKIFLLGETGVGKSTLINCLEGKTLAQEAKVMAPTTMEYKEYKSEKYKNYIFCDTRGIEASKVKKIIDFNIKSIKEKTKDLNFCLFWYLTGSTGSFQDSDVNYIKSIKQSLKKKIDIFFVITRSADDEEDKKRLDKTLKEYFPYNKNSQIFPVYARGTKRIPSYGLDDLMTETKNFFGKVILKYIFKYIYNDGNKYQELLKKRLDEPNNNIREIFHIVLNHFRLDDLSKELNHNENELIQKFLSEKYYYLMFDNINELKKIICLIKAKNEIIEMNNVEKASLRLININNNTLEDNNNLNEKEQILFGCSKEEKEKIEVKANNYLNDKNDKQIKTVVLKTLELYSGILFASEIENKVIEQLLNLNGLLI